MEQVHFHLDREQAFRAEQHEIWSDIESMARCLNVETRTGAMSDIYHSNEKELEEYLKSFELLSEQKGLLVFIKGKPVGLEFVSRDTAFSRLYNKLLKSYILEAIYLQHENRFKPKRSKNESQKKKASIVPGMEQARGFMEEATTWCQEKRFASIGMGISCRYQGEKIVGAALEVDSSIPHLAFFAISEGYKGDKPFLEEDNFSPLRIRKRYVDNR